jgi:hypothetical protein
MSGFAKFTNNKLKNKHFFMVFMRTPRRSMFFACKTTEIKSRKILILRLQTMFGKVENLFEQGLNRLIFNKKNEEFKNRV